METEEHHCAICLNVLNGNEGEGQSSTLITELKTIAGEWYNILPHNKLCSKCTHHIISITKTKIDILGLLLNNYSAVGLKNYMTVLRSFVLKFRSGSSESRVEELENFKVTSSVEQRLSRNVPQEVNEDLGNVNEDNALQLQTVEVDNIYEDDIDFSKHQDAYNSLSPTEKNNSPPSIDPDLFKDSLNGGISTQEATKKDDGIKLFNCGICQFHSTSRLELQMHNNKEHKLGNKYVCKICGSTFKRKYSCVFHQCVHSDIRPFSCKYCGRGFNWQSLLTKHERLHTGEKPYKCNLCDNAFRLREQLHKHKKSHNSGELLKVVADTREVCEKCGKLYSSHDALHRHLKTHDRKHQCQLCDFSTNDDEEYSKHQNRHSKARRHHCLICHKAFIRREHLTRHLRIHTGETPYRCSTCGKGFAQSQDVKKHERTHTGEKPYTCYHCNRSFTSKLSLKRHKCSVPEVAENCEIANELNIDRTTTMANEMFSLSQPTDAECTNLCLPEDMTELTNLAPSPDLSAKCSGGDYPEKSLHAEMQPMTNLIDQFSDVERSSCLSSIHSTSNLVSLTVPHSYSDSITVIDHTFSSANNSMNPVEAGNFLPNLCPSMLSSNLSVMMPASCINDEVATIIPDITQQNILVLGLQNMKTCSDEIEPRAE